MQKPKFIDHCLTIDPGLGQTSVAHWKRTLHPMTYKLTDTIPDEDTPERLYYMTKELRALITALNDSYFINIAYIEDVHLWGDSLVSLAAAKRDDLFLLSMLVGQYGMVCMDLGISVYLLSAISWKGTMNKQQVARRVYRRSCLEFKTSTGKFDDHTTDCVGMGYSLMGFL